MDAELNAGESREEQWERQRYVLGADWPPFENQYLHWEQKSAVLAVTVSL